MKHARRDYNERVQDLASKIPKEEPVFLLRGQDVYAAPLVRAWARKLLADGGDPIVVNAVNRHADEMAAWSKNFGKIPDTTREQLFGK